jgi:hypothetical protein
MAKDPKPRTITFSDGTSVPAKWLDDFSEDQIDAMTSETGQSKTMKDVFAVARQQIVAFCPGLTEEYLRTLPIRELEFVRESLFKWEASGDQQPPLETKAESGSTAPPSSPAS